jgi:hypothetical protein
VDFFTVRRTGFEGASPNNPIVNVYILSFYLCLQATFSDFLVFITHAGSSPVHHPKQKLAKKRVLILCAVQDLNL